MHRMILVMVLFLIATGCDTGSSASSNTSNTNNANENSGNSNNNASVPTCSPDNCAGCCDTDGFCQTGYDNAWCGTGGQQCANCNDQDGDCNTGICETLTCALAATSPSLYPCNFCAHDGSGIVHCGFCHRIPADDVFEACDLGFTCYEWDNPIYSSEWPATQCFAEPPELCDPDLFVNHCEGTVAMNCTAEALTTFDDCADNAGYQCEMVTIWDGSLRARCVAQ